MPAAVSSKRIGNSFEQEIGYIRRACEDKGIALFDKVEAPAKRVGTKMFFVEKALPDYVGCNREGTKLLFEAKNITSKKTLSIGKGGLKDHQLEKLIKYRQFGAICFILVRIKERVFYMSIDVVTSVTKDKKHISEEDFERYGVEITGLFNNFSEVGRYQWMFSR